MPLPCSGSSLVQAECPAAIVAVRAIRLVGSASSTPAFRVVFASDAAVGDRGDDRTDLDLLVRLDGGLAGTAVLLAPHDAQFGADRDFRIDRGEAERLLLVVRVAGEHREADGLATSIDDAVVVRRGVV